MSINKVILVGNVGKDPEVRHLDSGTSVANFPLATSESYTAKSGEKVTNTEWHNIVAWRGLAEVVENYIKKGSQLYVEGKIRTRSYEQDGVKKYRTEIFADSIQMLGRKDDTASDGGHSYQENQVSNQNSAKTSNNNNTSGDDSVEDDLPF